MDQQKLFMLGEYLNDNLSLQTCDSTLNHSAGWLKANGVEDLEIEIEWLEQAGANCDCEVVLKLYVPMLEEQAKST